MISWIVLSILVKVVCVASLIATIVGTVQVVKAREKDGRARDEQRLIVLCPSAAVFAITLFGSILVNMAFQVFF